MKDSELQELRKKLGLDGLDAIAKDIADRNKRDELARVDAEKALAVKAEKERVFDLVKSANAEQAEKLVAAVEMISALEKKLAENDVSGFAKSLEDMQTELTQKSSEIAQIVATRQSGTSVSSAVSKALFTPEVAKDIDSAVLLGALMNKGFGDTKLGASIKAVNASSSIEVSDDEYETIFSDRIIRDIQDLLVVGNLFPFLDMSAKSLTMQIEPTAGTANWVAATTYGTTATTGNEVTTALTAITFTTHKLAAKAYMTDETTEDAITALLPIIRRHLIEAHVNAIESAFMGTPAAAAAGVPTGLIRFGTSDNTITATAATHDSTTAATKVTAAILNKLRRPLGLKGLKLNSLVLIISMDAYYDLLEDPAFQDMDKVGKAAIKLTGQVGRVYGMPVIVSSNFPTKAAAAAFALVVYKDDFIVPRQRKVTVESERIASEQRDAYYVTQRVNLQRYFNNNVSVANYAT